MDVRMDLGVEAPRLYCPFALERSPDLTGIVGETMDWATRMGLFRSDAEARAYEGARIGALIAMAFPRSSAEIARLIADCTTLLCIVDDRVESLGSPSEVACFLVPLLEVCDGRHGVSSAPHDPPAARALQDLVSRAAALGTPRAMRRLAHRLEEVFAAYVEEAYEREARTPPRLDTYIARRRATIALHPLFVLWELELGAGFPDHVRLHPRLTQLAARTCDAVGWANDIFTCSKELRAGEVHNIVIVLMAQGGLSYRDALAQAVAMHDEQVRGLEQDADALPSFGSTLDAQARRYVDMLRSCVRGHLAWAIETGRYRSGGAAPTGPQPLERRLL